MNISTSRPTLSVLLSNYNHAQYLRAALNAILAQSYRPMEVIIIDDASTDDSVAIIDEYVRRDPLIHLIRNERNKGIVRNTQVLLQLAKGDYVVGCACDDVILPGFLERSMDLLTEYPEAGLCSTLTRIIDASGEDRGVLPAAIGVGGPCFLPPARVREIFTDVGSWLQGNTIVYRRDALIAAGGFRPELLSLTDSFAAQTLAVTHGACFIPEALTAWRQLPGSYSRQMTQQTSSAESMIVAAAHLMRTEFRGVFPEKYVARWLNDQRFQFERMRLRLRRATALTALASRDPAPARATVFPVEYGLRRTAINAAWLAANVGALLRHRPIHAGRRAVWRLAARVSSALPTVQGSGTT